MRVLGKTALQIALIVLLTLLEVFLAEGQISGPPTSNCHITDGSFSTCPNAAMEWSDVTPLSFPASNSFLYVNQDSAHAFLYLMYDFPFRTAPLAATDSVHVSFDTVSQDSGIPGLEQYDILIFGNGQMQVQEQGKPTPAGRIVGASGFGISPNSSTPHVMAELQVPLTPGPPTAYSPDPLFWSATVPPTPPAPPSPPICGSSSSCKKSQAYIDAMNQASLSYAQAANNLTAVGVIVCGAIALKNPAAGFGCAAAFALKVRSLTAESLQYAKNALDPNDPNFTIIAIPPVLSLPGLPITAGGTGLSDAVVADLNTLFADDEQIISLLQVIPICINRANGASAAGNTSWYEQQAQAARTYASQLIALLSNRSAAYSTLASDFAASGIIFDVKTSDIVNAIAPLQQNGFTPADAAILTALGLSPDDQTAALQLVRSISPELSASLGTGVFPRSLTDPSLSTVNNQAVAALTDLATAPAASTLTPSFNFTVAGDYTSAGTGLRGETSGNINISAVPAGGTAQKAFLYWGMLDNGEDLSLHQLTFNGTPITGTRIGSGPDTCWGRTNSFTYRADVTPYVTGNGTYALTGVATGGNILAEGASLVVVYQLPGAPFKTIMIDDGNIALPKGSTSGTASFSGFSATQPVTSSLRTAGQSVVYQSRSRATSSTGSPTVTAATTFMVGDGQSTNFGAAPVTFTSNLGALSFPNLFASTDGLYWDNDTFDVSSVVGSDSSNGTAAISVASDCLLWSAQAFSVTVTPAQASGSVTATAAVVQANANGDTVVNGRGLGSGDAPTLEEQIQMIVQNQIIQNPSTNPQLLTSQLLTSLVNDGIVSPTQANNIENSVVGAVVVPVRLTITTKSLTDGVVGVAYSQTLAAINGTTPYLWSIVSGRLPAGLSLNATTGQITGVPTNETSSLITFQVTDSSAPRQNATVALVLTVSSKLTITSTSLPNGKAGAPYSQTLQTMGGILPLTWGLNSGAALPPGLSLNTATGEISGTPTSTVSNYRFLVQVKDSTAAVAQTATAAFFITITN